MIVKNLALLSFLAFLAAGLLTAPACKKGDTGPAGPVGPAGPDSVQYSAWKPLSMTFNTTDSAYEQTITAPAITSSVLSKGSVMGYLMVQSPSGDSSIVNAALVITEFFSVGKIQLLSNADYSGLNYRYVIIPGKVSVSSTTGAPQTYSGDQLKGMDYATLSRILNIH